MLVQLFVQSQSLGVTDPHDRVYGLLALATDYDEGEMVVDYKLPSLQAYLQVFQHFIRKHKSLGFLCVAGSKRRDSTISGVSLPSWAPSHGIRWVEATRSVSRASGASSAKNAFIDTSTGTLHAQGFLVDRITLTRDASNLERMPILDALTWVEDFCNKLWPGVTERPLYERDDVTSVLFPWVGKTFYRRFLLDNAGGKPEAEERKQAIRSLRRAALSADDKSLSIFRVLQGGYMPIDILSKRERTRVFQIQWALMDRVLVGTHQGRIGSMLVSSVIPGDEVWIIVGCPMPLVLRKKPDGAGYLHVGFVVVPDLMDGKVFGALSESASDEVKIF
jgi:hypothetical protein